MLNQEKIYYWVELSDYDLETAQALLKTKRYLYVGFMCHQVIEKIIKAYYYSVKNEMPPYIHSLLRLAEKSDLIRLLNEEQLVIIDELEPLNIEGRYPSYKEELMKTLNTSRCEKLLTNTTILQQWIKKML